MKPYDLVKMAGTNLARRKLRIILTLTGVLIGTTAIIVMLSIGIGLDNMTRSSIEELGSINTIEVSSYGNMDMAVAGDSGGGGSSRNKAKKLTDEVVEEIKQLDNVTMVMPYIKIQSTELTAGKYAGYSEIIAVAPENMKTFGYRLADGRYLTREDKFSVLIGAGVHKGMYNAKDYRDSKQLTKVDMLEKGLKLGFTNYTKEGKKPKKYRLEVAGSLKSAGYETDNSIFMNLDYYLKFKEQMDKKYPKANKKKSRKVAYTNLKVYVKDLNKVEKVQKELEKLGYSAYSLTQFLQQAKSQMALIQAVLGGMGAISLLVAAIGITNTMIMSIYERTKEIGVMKVIGANLKDIKRLFLTEAAMIGLLGGILGILFSYLISIIINMVGGNVVSGMIGGEMGLGGEGGGGAPTKISIIPLWLVGASIVFSALVGVLSGYMPAKRAMKLSALEAIRTS